MTDTPYATAALRYMSHGWAPLPLGDRPRLKAMPPSGYTGNDGSDPGEDQVAEWCRNKGALNIGVRLPAGVIGIDVDDYDDKPGAATMIATAQHHGKLPSTWVSTSRDGLSGIRWFRGPKSALPGKLLHPDDENTSGVEIIQHTHRYAVVPPSIHPSGSSYRWITPDGEPVSNGRLPTPDELPELPQAWIDHIRKECSCWVPVNFDWGRYHGEKRDPVAETLEKWSARLTEAYGRHDAALGGVMALVAFRHRGWPGAQEALDRLESQFYTSLGESRNQREAQSEWKRMIDGAEAKAASSSIPDWRPAPTAPAMPEQPEQRYTPEDPRVAEELDKLRVREAAKRLWRIESQPSVRIPEIRTLTHRLANPLPPVNWRVDGWQPAGTRVMLAAQFKAGKTTMTGNLTRSLVDGALWLDVTAVRPVEGRVGVLDFEMSERQIDEWLGDQGIENTDQVVIIPMRGKASAFDILDPDTHNKWVDILRGHDIEYLIFDCLRPVLDAMGLDEHRDAGKFLVPFDELLDKAQIPDALVVHHMGHQGERSRGDSRLRDWPDVEWRLVRADDNPSSPRYITAFGRDVDIHESELSYNETTRHLRLIGGSRRDAEARDTIPDIISTLEASDEPMSGNAIYLALRDTTEHKQKAIRQGLVLAQHAERIVATPAPRNTTLYSLPGGQK